MARQVLVPKHMAAREREIREAMHSARVRRGRTWVT